MEWLVCVAIIPTSSLQLGRNRVDLTDRADANSGQRPASREQKMLLIDHPDLQEGTNQIQRVVIAKRLLG